MVKGYYTLVHSFIVVVCIAIAQPSDSDRSKNKIDWLKTLLENRFSYYIFPPVPIQLSNKKFTCCCLCCQQYNFWYIFSVSYHMNSDYIPFPLYLAMLMINVSVISDFYFYMVYNGYQRIRTTHYNNISQLQLHGQPNC